MTKAQVSKMTTEELQEQKLDLKLALDAAKTDKDKNIIKGYIGLIEVELHNREIQPAADGQGTEETIIIGGDVQMNTNISNDEQKELDASPSIKPAPSTLAGIMTQVGRVLDGETNDNEKLARIVKLAENNIDYSVLPFDLCSDAELMRRLKLVWSKKVAAKKANKLDVLADLEHQENELNSYRDHKANRTGTVSSDNVDHSTLSQLDLQKLIRNYQSKKSGAKKLYEAAILDIAKATDPVVVEALTKSADENKNLMEHWQAKVDDASKYRTSTPAAARSAELTGQIKDMIALLKTLPQTDEVVSQIKKLEASI